jgi:hypothetical protein
MAKQQKISNKFTNGLVKYSIPELCKMAHISVPSEDREYILYDIVQNKLIGYPKKNNTQCLLVNFIDDESEPVLTLNETDCQELAYQYLKWKDKDENDNKYKKCECCKRLMKVSKKNPQRFCESCSKIVGDVPDDIRVVLCKDCDTLVYIENPKDTRTLRCNSCAEKERQRVNKEYYKKNKN